MVTKRTNLRRRVPWILFCVVLAAAAAYGVSEQQTKKYTATASLVFNESQLGQQIAGLPAASGSSQQAQQNTNLVQFGDVAAKTADAVGQGITKESILAGLSVSAPREANVVSVSDTATSPALAANIANAYAEEFVAEQRSRERRSYASALKLVNQQLAALSPKERAGGAGIALRERAQSLTLAGLGSGSVQLAQLASVPTAPSSPKVARNTILGAVAGLLLGLGSAFLLERADGRIREPRDFEAIYDLPLLGVVPKSAALARSARRRKNASNALPPREAEAFNSIRAHLRYINVDRDLRTVLVVSAAPGDGKTTVARHLASAAARMGSRVLLLEADLRHPKLAQQLDLRSGPGVSDVLAGKVSLSEATQRIYVNLQSTDDSGKGVLHVAVAGAEVPPNPGELMESHAMEVLLETTRSSYDLVVIDTPPLIAVSDAFPLLRRG